MKHKVLVLGASGFIGKRVVAALAATEWAQPIAASRSVRAVANENMTCVQLDATDPAAVSAALVGVTGVVNCIAGDARTIVASAQALFAAVMATTSTPRVVHLSSLAAYGSITGTLDESAPLLGDLDAYSAAKAQVERDAKGCANVVCLRPGIVYGPDSAWWSDHIARLLFAQRIGDLGAAGNGRCNLVYVDDVVKAILIALRKPGIAGQAFNLSLPSPPTWNGYFAQYASALGIALRRIPRWRLALELGPLMYVYKLRELGARAFAADRWRPAPPIRPWLLQRCQHAIVMNVRCAETQLGMTWTPLPDGLKQTAAWFLADGRT
jgi:2-alkyl-3-oxoalkanoate reductase